VIDCPATRIWRRVLGLAVCYVLILQAFFAAAETAVALFQANATNGALVICHNANSVSPSTGDSGKPEKLACLLCAVAAAGGGLLPDPVAAVFAPRVLAGGVNFAKSIAISLRPPARDGCSRAPPRFA
jgi:O-antigen/teichoic acid export membrane protein